MKNFKEKIASLIVVKPVSWGEAVWRLLDERLPKAYGSIQEDELRIELFKEMTSKLSFLDLYALKVYLKHSYDELEDSFPEHFTGREEQLYCKWRQIYREHLEAITKKPSD